MARSKAAAKRDRWADWLRAQAASELTVAQFCEKLGVWPATFYYWRRRLDEKGGPPVDTQPAGSAGPRLRFLAVQVAASSQVEVHLTSGARVLVPCHEMEAIRDGVAALVGGGERGRSC